MEQDPIVYLNGTYAPLSQTHISPLDRGFLFGDAAYEVIKSNDGKLLYPQPHIDRLHNSLMGIRLEFDSYDELPNIFPRLLAANQLEQGQALIYLQISRGAYAKRSHEFPSAKPAPTVFAMASPAPSPSSSPLRLISHPDERWARPSLKTANLLPNCLAKQLAVEQQADEVVLVRNGTVIECSSSALAIVKNEVVYTHPPADHLLPSITMQIIKELCSSEKIEFNERPFTLAAAYDADELLVASTVKDISPAVELDGKKIGDGKIGKIAKQLMDAFKRL